MARGFNASRLGFGAAERASAARGMLAREADEQLKGLGMRPMGELTQDSYVAFEPANAGPKFKNERSDPTSLVNTELSLRENTQYEVGAFFDGNTGKPVVASTDYKKDGVFFTMDKIKALRAVPGGVIFTHNHPRSTSFSVDDFILMLGANCREFRITSQRFSYSLSDKSGKFREKGIGAKTLRLKKGFTKEAMEGVRQKIEEGVSADKQREFAQDAIRAAKEFGTNVDDEMERARSNYVVGEMAKHFGLEYRRTILRPSKT